MFCEMFGLPKEYLDALAVDAIRKVIEEDSSRRKTDLRNGQTAIEDRIFVNGVDIYKKEERLDFPKPLTLSYLWRHIPVLSRWFEEKD